MILSGRSRGRRRQPVPSDLGSRSSPRAQIREFVYLDEVSVQSLLASLIGELPSEVTSLSARSLEAELSARVGSAVPLTPSVDFASRFKGASSTSSQTLSRAVAESLFKRLYELVASKLVWTPGAPDPASPVILERGDLIEIEVILAPDPVYGFNSVMGVMAGIADDYPALYEQGATAAILEEARPVQAVLERLLAGLIPLKSVAVGLRASQVEDRLVLAPTSYFREPSTNSTNVSVVGVTEQDKYWRDVRRVLFSGDRFTILGRIARDGLQAGWTPVKVMEVMREIAPEFFDAMASASKIGFAEPINLPVERNRDAMENALKEFANAATNDAATAEQRAAIAAFAKNHRGAADNMTSQRDAFKQLEAWLVDAGILAAPIPEPRAMRVEARKRAGLRGSAEVRNVSDFQPATRSKDIEPDVLIDLEVIAIYW